MAISGYRALASDLILDAIRILDMPPPSSTAPKDRKRTGGKKLCPTCKWVRGWQAWRDRHNRETDFFNSPRKSAVWCELAGFDWDAVVSRVRARGLLYAAESRVPQNLAEISQHPHEKDDPPEAFPQFLARRRIA